MENRFAKQWVSLNTEEPIWSRFFTVAPLVVIGTKEGEKYDLAPKHMATALGHDNYFGFVCTAHHATYHNIKREQVFTVSFPGPDQLILASLAAAPRCANNEEGKAILESLPTCKAQKVDALFIEHAYLYLECELDRIIDGFGDFSLIAGKIIAAYVHEDALRISEGDDQQLIYETPLIAYLPYGRFATIKDTYAFPFPKGFRQKVLAKPSH